MVVGEINNSTITAEDGQQINMDQINVLQRKQISDPCRALAIGGGILVVGVVTLATIFYSIVLRVPSQLL